MLENNISRNNKIPGSSGCDSYTRPEEIKALSKFLGEQRKTLDGSIGLDETLLGVPGETTGRIPEVVLSSKIDSLDLSRVDDIIKLNEKLVTLDNNSSPIGANITSLPQGFIGIENSDNIDLSDKIETLQSEQEIDLEDKVQVLDVEGEIELDTTKKELSDDTNLTGLEDTKVELSLSNDVTELGNKIEGLDTTDIKNLEDHIEQLKDNSNISLSDEIKLLNDSESIELSNKVNVLDDNTDINKLSETKVELVSDNKTELIKDLKKLEVTDNIDLGDSKISLETGDVENNLEEKRVDLINTSNIQGLSESIITLENKEHADSLSSVRKDLESQQSISELSNELVGIEDLTDITLRTDSVDLKDDGKIELGNTKVEFKDETKLELSSPLITIDPINFPDLSDFKDIINDDTVLELGDKKIDLTTTDNVELGSSIITVEDNNEVELSDKSIKVEDDNNIELGNSLITVEDSNNIELSDKSIKVEDDNNIELGNRLENLVDSGEFSLEDFLDTIDSSNVESLDNNKELLGKAISPITDNDYEYFDPSIPGSKLYSGKPGYIEDPTKTVVLGKENLLPPGKKYSGDLMILELHDKSYMTKNDKVKYTIKDQDHVKLNNINQSITESDRDKILDDAYITKTEALDGYIQDSYYIPDSEAPENDSDYNYRGEYQLLYDKESLQSTQERLDHIKYSKFSAGGEIIESVEGNITSKERDEIINNSILNPNSRLVEYSKENETPRPENDSLYLPNFTYSDSDKELILTGQAQEIFDKIMNFSFSKDGKVTRDSLKVGENKAYIDGVTTTVSNWLQKIQALVGTYLNPGPYQSDWDTEKEEGKDLNGDGFIGKGMLKTKEDLKKELPRLEQFETKINQAIETAIFATKLETPRYKLPESSIGFEVSNYLRWIAEETVGLTKLSGNKKEILLRETLALIVWARDEAVKLAKADKSRLPGNTGLISDIVSGGLNVGNVVSSVSKAVSNAIFPDQTNPINRPELDDTGRISTSAWTNNSRVPSVSSSGDSKQEKKSIWKTLKDVTIGGSTPGNYSFAENYLNGIGIETTLLDLVGKNVSMIKNGTVEEFFDLLKSSPYITTVGKAGSSDGGYKVSTLDSNAYWEVILEPYAGVLNGEYTFLPLFGEINEINKKLHGVTTSYSRWIPVNSFELQKEKMTTRTLGLFDGEITYPTSVEFTNEFRLTIVDDQYKSWRTYFEKCLMAAVYSCKPNKLRDTKGKRKVFYVYDKRFLDELEAKNYALKYAEINNLSSLPEVTMKEEDFDTAKMLEDELIFDGEIRKLDKSFQLVAPYKNLSFRCRILVMTPQMSTITKYDLLLVLKDFAEERSGEIDSAGSDLTLSFSIVGENPPDRIATSSILAITDTGVGNMNKLREQEAAERKKDALKSVASGLLKSGPSMAIGLLS